MKVGEKVWVMWGGEWAKAVIVPLPEGAVAQRNRVCVCFENFADVYRVSKSWVKVRA